MADRRGALSSEGELAAASNKDANHTHRSLSVVRGGDSYEREEGESSLEGITIALPIRSLDPSFQLQLDGKGINLTDFASHFVNKIGSHEISEYLFSDKITRAIVDSRLELVGDGYSRDRISAQLTLDNLHVDLTTATC